MADEKRVRAIFVACGRQRSGESSVAQTLQETTKSFPIDWQIVTSQRDALRAARLTPPYLIVVDLNSTYQRQRFCELLRSRAPIAKLIGLATTPVAWHDLLDACLDFPLQPQQVVQVLTTVLDGAGPQVLQRGQVRLHLDTRTVVTPRGRYHMTPKQMALLQFFMQHHGQTLTRLDLMRGVWDTDYMADTRTLDVHIRWLRERIEADPSDPHYLVTVRNQGYRLILE